MKNRHIVPFKIIRDDYFFAKVDWILYKLFHIKRKYPCGRRKTGSSLCCCQGWDEKFFTYSEDRKKIYCKVCGEVRETSNKPIIKFGDIEW